MKASNEYLEYGSRTWDTVCLTPNFSLLLTGIGVYVPSSGGGEVTIKVDARPLTEPLKPIDVETPLESLRDDGDPPTFTIFSRKPFFIAAGELWEIVLNVSTNRRRFDPFSDNRTWVCDVLFYSFHREFKKFLHIGTDGNRRHQAVCNT